MRLPVQPHEGRQTLTRIVTSLDFPGHGGMPVLPVAPPESSICKDLAGHTRILTDFRHLDAPCLYSGHPPSPAPWM